MQEQQPGLGYDIHNLPDELGEGPEMYQRENTNRRGLAGLKARLRRWLDNLLSQIHPGGISMMDL